MSEMRMTTALQPRAQKTRARLLAVAQEVITETGYGNMRVEEVVRRAGVAKGTFFAHFKDKDALMDRLIGAEIDAHLDRLAAQPAPSSLPALIKALMPLMAFMTCERYVFDVIIRYSGAAAQEEIGPIATTFERFVTIMAGWLAEGHFRTDADPGLLAEGVQAFMVQVMALNFCALHNTIPVETRLTPFLALWLTPNSGLDPQG